MVISLIILLYDYIIILLLFFFFFLDCFDIYFSDLLLALEYENPFLTQV